MGLFERKMKSTSLVVLSLLFVASFVGSSQAVSLRLDPDVFGPEGDDYINNNTNIDTDTIAIDILKKGHHGKKKCESGQLATFSWTGELEDGRVVTDSVEEFGKDVTLTLGTDNTYKCLELALQQLHAGDKATVTCPSNLVFGNNVMLSPINGEMIPKDSKVSFDIEIKDCNYIPKKIKYGDQPKSTTMQPSQCFYLKLVESDNTAYSLVLATMEDDESKEWPGKRAYFEEQVMDDET